MHLFKAYAQSATTNIDNCTEYSWLNKIWPCDAKKMSVTPVSRTAKDSSRRHKTFVWISKSAVRDFVLFIKSIYFTMHFGCNFFFVKPRAFFSALFFSDFNIKAWNVITMITSLGNCVLIAGNTIGNLKVWTYPTILCPRIQRSSRTYELALQRGKLGIL